MKNAVAVLGWVELIRALTPVFAGFAKPIVSGAIGHAHDGFRLKARRSAGRCQCLAQPILRLRPASQSVRCCRALSPRDPLDGGAAGGELVLEALEATVEVIDAVDHGLALGR